MHSTLYSSAYVLFHGAAGFLKYRSSRILLAIIDPTYKDRYGSPLLRMTFGWHPNEMRMSAYITEKLAGIGEEMGASQI